MTDTPEKLDVVESLLRAFDAPVRDVLIEAKIVQVTLSDEYALGIDTRDWTLYRSIFTDEITMDFSSYSGAPAATMTADAWVAQCKPLFEGLDARV